MLKLMPRTNGHYRFKPSQNSPEVGQFMLRDDGDCLSIWAFSIYGEHRGNGYGQQMLKDAIEVAGKNKLVLYVLKDNKRAIHIYEKLGFVISGEYMCKTAWKMTYVGNEVSVNV